MLLCGRPSLCRPGGYDLCVITQDGYIDYVDLFALLNLFVIMQHSKIFSDCWLYMVSLGSRCILLLFL